jgi:hypothetical protein
LALSQACKHHTLEGIISNLIGERQIPETLSMVMNYTAPAHVAKVIANLGRTEDIKFSPTNRRLAVAGFERNQITIFDIYIDSAQRDPTLEITDVVELSSSHLQHPHGVDFFDDDTIIVANRDGDAAILRVPPVGSDSCQLMPVGVIPGNVLAAPGSVAVIRKGFGLYEVLICNNRGHTVTRHLLDLSTEFEVKANHVVLQRWLDSPDGISISSDMQWVAISNHGSHSVLIYENSSRLNESSSPVGILRCVYSPHGLRFTNDCRFLHPNLIITVWHSFASGGKPRRVRREGSISQLGLLSFVRITFRPLRKARKHHSVLTMCLLIDRSSADVLA